MNLLLLGSYIPFAFAFETWWLSVLLAILMEVLIYPILAWAEHLPRFSSFVNERKGGECKHSLLLAFTMLAVCNTVCWGLLGDKYLGIACMYAWGVGDAFAALVGKRFGKHKITWKYADHHKSLEGSAAMFVTSGIAVACVLLTHNHLTLPAYIVIPIAGAAAATVVEIVSKEGYDTSDKGNVIPGLAIAVLGVIVNTIFWRKYTKLNKADPNAILAVQARLYRAKSMVDTCVTVALLSVVIMPASKLSIWLDFIGSLIVAAYLIWCGIQTIYESRTGQNRGMK